MGVQGTFVKVQFKRMALSAFALQAQDLAASVHGHSKRAHQCELKDHHLARKGGGYSAGMLTKLIQPARH